MNKGTLYYYGETLIKIILYFIQRQRYVSELYFYVISVLFRIRQVKIYTYAQNMSYLLKKIIL